MNLKNLKLESGLNFPSGLVPLSSNASIENPEKWTFWYRKDSLYR